MGQAEFQTEMGTPMARTRIVGYVVSAVLIGAVVTGSGCAISIETVLELDRQILARFENHAGDFFQRK